MPDKFTATISAIVLFLLLCAALGLYGYKNLHKPPALYPRRQPAPAPPLTPTRQALRKSLTQLTAAARADLARRLSLQPSAITTKSVEATTWNDSSLGCPKVGKMYLPVLTSGYRIVLQAAGKKYNYHTNLQQVYFCPVNLRKK